jgi:hypothetical protein
MNIRKPAKSLVLGALLTLTVVSIPAGHVDAMSTGSGSGSGKTLCSMFTGTGPNDLIIIREEGETYTDKNGTTWKCTHWGDWLMVPLVSNPPTWQAPVRSRPVGGILGS